MVNLFQIYEQAARENVRVTVHAQQEMAAENYTLDDVLFGISKAQLLEDYPEHRRGACCLLGGETKTNRPIHLVVTTGQPVLIIITVYEPMPPKWRSATERKGSDEM